MQMYVHPVQSCLIFWAHNHTEHILALSLSSISLRTLRAYFIRQSEPKILHLVFKNKNTTTNVILRKPSSYYSAYLLLQEKIDTARNYYQQLLFRYTKETSSEDQGSRHNATLHKALKTVKDFGETIQSEVLNKQTKINA